MIKDKNELKKYCMGIVNQLYYLAEVPVDKRQAINDKADEYLIEQVLQLYVVSHRRELLETVINELDTQVGTNYSSDENLLDTIESSL